MNTSIMTPEKTEPKKYPFYPQPVPIDFLFLKTHTLTVEINPIDGQQIIIVTPCQI